MSRYTRRIYFAERADTGLIKIGCSTYPLHRCKQLTIDLKTPVKLLTESHGGYPGMAHERALHRQFAESRVEGEWFRGSPSLLAVVEHVRATGEIPELQAGGREEEFRRRYLAGETLRSIGEDHGVSRERVRQVLRQIGVPSLGWRSSIIHRAAEDEWRRQSAAA